MGGIKLFIALPRIVAVALEMYFLTSVAGVDVFITIVHFITMVHFTVVCLVAKPLNRSKAKGDLVMIQTLLLFKCEFKAQMIF